MPNLRTFFETVARRQNGVVSPPSTVAAPDIDVVWSRIAAHCGEEFRQIRGGVFRYEVSGGALRPDRTNRQIPKSDFKKALGLVPLTSTVGLQHLQGPSYIYAVLMDPRIRQGDW